MGFWSRIAIVVAAPLLLAGCLLTPGRFTSDMTVRADRSFSFAYKGEVIAIDPGESMTGGLSTSTSAEETAASRTEKARKAAELETKRRAVAEALAKEAGYRSVRYLGGGRYMIDFAIQGRLDHGFVYPFNTDAEVVFPFIAAELRGDGTIRVKAPAFGKPSGGSGGMESMPGMPDSADQRDGSFTFSTDAEIVMHNNEAGVTQSGGMKVLTWRITPLTKDAPTAVVRVR